MGIATLGARGGRRACQVAIVSLAGVPPAVGGTAPGRLRGPGHEGVLGQRF